MPIVSKYMHPILYPWSDEQVIQYANLHPLAYQVLIPKPEYIRWNVLEQNKKNYPVYSKYPEKITWNALKCIKMESAAKTANSYRN